MTSWSAQNDARREFFGDRALGDRMRGLTSPLSRTAFLKLGTAFAAVTTISPMAAQAQETEYKRVNPIQFIAALGDKTASSGTGADKWGIWRVDPGPRGVELRDYDKLEKSGGIAPRGKWQFNKDNWWLEEHGLIMEAPDFPVTPGKYLVTGGRETTAELTITEDYKWTLGTPRGTSSDLPAKLFDVTHLPCRAARYTGGSPANAKQTDFPVTPGAAMPVVPGSEKLDYAVLFVVGIAA